MKKLLQIGCFFALCTTLQADSQTIDLERNDQEIERKCCKQTSHFGTSGFQTTDPANWYTISTHSYPDSVPLSLQRNAGFADGDVYLSPTGFTIGEAGNYWVSLTAILQNPGVDSVLIPVFLARDETFDAAAPEMGSVVVVEPNAIRSAQSSGILRDVVPGTRISLVATNGGNPLPQDVSVVGWNISLFKLPN